MIYKDLQSNFCFYYTIINTEECFRLLTEVFSLNHFERLPERQLTFNQYEIKKMNKLNNKNSKDSKSSKIQSQLITLDDQDLSFVYHLEKSNNISPPKIGHFALSSKEFIQSNTYIKIFGEKTIKKQVKLVMENFLWDTYMISNIKLPNNKSIFILKECTISNIYPSFIGHEHADSMVDLQIQKRIKMVFEPILEIFFLKEETGKMIEKYTNELCAIKKHHNEIIKKMQKNSEINFALLQMFIIMKSFLETEQFV